MKIKKEVKNLCSQYVVEKTGSKKWHDLVEVLIKKYKFTSYNLLALSYSPPVIEFNKDNKSLVMD